MSVLKAPHMGSDNEITGTPGDLLAWETNKASDSSNPNKRTVSHQRWRVMTPVNLEPSGSGDHQLVGEVCRQKPSLSSHSADPSPWMQQRSSRSARHPPSVLPQPLSTRASEQLATYGLSAVPTLNDLQEFKVLCSLLDTGKLKCEELAMLAQDRKILTSASEIKRAVHGRRDPDDLTHWKYPPKAYLTATLPPKAKLASRRRAPALKSSSEHEQQPQER